MDDNSIDFAFKYPFSKEAKALIAELNINHIDPFYISTSKAQIEELLKNINSRRGKEGKRIEFYNTGYRKAKIDYIIGYVYSKMMISAIPSFIPQFAEGVAERSASAMELDSPYNIEKVGNELSIRIINDKDIFKIYYIDYLNNTPNDEAYAMANFNLSKGYVELDKHQAITVLKEVMMKSIENELPIKSNIPKEVIDASKSIRIVSERTYTSKGGREYGWIERLMSVPIPDCRHRTVNLILAPYLINIKNMDVGDASAKIEQYIEMCKRVNPNTKINEHYIKYQCEYAKKHGSKPLSLKRAKNELSTIDFSMIAGNVEENTKENVKEEQKK
ncbi:MAG: DNA primase noncatalytic subunit PriX [Candidatus Micrarchaeia archaeon]